FSRRTCRSSVGSCGSPGFSTSEPPWNCWTFSKLLRILSILALTAAQRDGLPCVVQSIPDVLVGILVLLCVMDGHPNHEPLDLIRSGSPPCPPFVVRDAGKRPRHRYPPPG